MYVRNTDNATEYKRQDSTFYKGIVVKNNDPERLFRVKIYIPELSNQPLEDWLSEYSYFSIRFPGKNNENDNWSDTKVFEHISKFLPWAEPCYPITGESGPGRFHSPYETATISDTNYPDYFEDNNETPPSLEEGVFGPAWFYENYTTALGDYFCDQNNKSSVNNNPYGYIGRPSMNVNKAKGMFGVPSVGSKVWVFFYNGDINSPVYFGTRHDYRETSLIYNLDQIDCRNVSIDHPDIFENLPKK